MTRMFSEVRATWNPVVGCSHGCRYCYARELAETKLSHLERYRDGFRPKLVEQELKRRFKEGLVFVSDMGDLWGEWVPPEWIEKVVVAIRQSPLATFLFLTKNPGRYHEFLPTMPPNVILGATIETNRHTGMISRAPSTLVRMAQMVGIQGRRKLISIEPIMAFDLSILTTWIKRIAPEAVYIGFDNHGHELPEPRLEETEALIRALGEFTEVRRKTLREAWRPVGNGK